jgi:hypothetical protein
MYLALDFVGMRRKPRSRSPPESLKDKIAVQLGVLNECMYLQQLNNPRGNLQRCGGGTTASIIVSRVPKQTAVAEGKS